MLSRLVRSARVPASRVLSVPLANRMPHGALQFCCTGFSRSMSTKDGWFRPNGAFELFTDDMYRNHGLVISYYLRFATSRPVTEQEIKKVCTHLYRKAINLRLIPKERDGQIWFKELPVDHPIDFEMRPDADANAVFHEMGKYRYREDGPAWSVRFLPRSPKQDEFMEFTAMEKTEGILKKLPHVSHVIFSYHHSITDGFTCVRLARNFLTLLNDVIAGNAIDETTQYARMLDIVKQDALLDQIQKSFENDPKLLKERTESYLRCSSEAFLNQAYPQPSKRRPEIVCLPRSLDSKTTAKFTARCKKEGLTVHTGFCSVVEATVVRMLQKAKLNREKYPIGGLHSVDQRYYWKGEEEAFGVGFGIIDCTYEWPNDVFQNFWANARKYHDLFKYQHSKISSMEHGIIEKLTGQTPLFFIGSEGLDYPPPKLTTYGTTNMRNVDEFFGNTGEHVRLIYYDRLSAVQDLPLMWLSTFQTFDGQLMHSFQYNTQLMDNTLANNIADTTFTTLNDVVDMP